jgi:hypothetical protein
VTAFLISQILVAVVFVIALATFQFRQRKHVLLCCVAITILLGTHFLLLDARTAGLLALIASVRYVVAIRSRSQWWVVAFLFVVAVTTVLTYDGTLSLLAGAGSVFTTMATFQSNKALREISMLASVVWILHNLVAGSPGAFALEVFFLASNVVGYWRYFLRKGAVVIRAGTG